MKFIKMYAIQALLAAVLLFFSSIIYDAAFTYSIRDFGHCIGACPISIWERLLNIILLPFVLITIAPKLIFELWWEGSIGILQYIYWAFAFLYFYLLVFLIFYGVRKLRNTR